MGLAAYFMPIDFSIENVNPNSIFKIHFDLKSLVSLLRLAIACFMRSIMISDQGGYDG